MNWIIEVLIGLIGGAVTFIIVSAIALAVNLTQIKLDGGLELNINLGYRKLFVGQKMGKRLKSALRNKTRTQKSCLGMHAFLFGIGIIEVYLSAFNKFIKDEDSLIKAVCSVTQHECCHYVLPKCVPDITPKQQHWATKRLGFGGADYYDEDIYL